MKIKREPEREAMNNILMLMMAGKGTRLGADRPKQYLEVDGIPVFAYILYAYWKTGRIDQMVLVIPPEWQEYTQDWVQRLQVDVPCHIAIGAEERSLSLQNGVTAAREFAAAEDILLIHDATHPYVDETGLDEVIRATRDVGAATLAQGEYDTVYRQMENRIQEVIPRQHVVSGASPEAFRFGIIDRIIDRTIQTEGEAGLRQMTSAGALALAHRIPLAVVESHVLNLKLTYPGDFELMEKLIHNYFFPGIREEIQERGME